MNLSKFKLEYILKATPYKKYASLDGLLTEEVFEELFVKYKYYDIIAENISVSIDSKPEGDPFIRFFKGYAGTGKTTFIHWFCNKNKHNYKFSFLDFYGTDSFVHKREEGHHDHEYQIEKKLIPALSIIYENNPASIADLFIHLYDNTTRYNASFSSDFFEKLCPAISIENRTIASKLDLNKFLNGITYTELFLLLLLYYNKYEEHFIKCTKGNENLKNSEKNLLLIIDNLDSIEMEPITRDIPRNFLSVYRIYLDMIWESNYFFRSKKIDFIYCLRDTIHAVMNPQERDYIDAESIDFIPNMDDLQQNLRRIIFAKKHDVKVDEKTEKLYKYICQKDEVGTKKSYMPLYNYNNRQFAININKIALRNHVFLDEIIKMGDIGRSPHTTIGIRGIFYFLFIRYMRESEDSNFFNSALSLDEGYFTEDNKTVHVNPVRIFLTILLNRSQYQLDVETKKETSIPVKLMDIYEEYFHIFEKMPNVERRFFEMITNLFLFYKTNWCHLITILGKSTYNVDSYRDEIDSLKKYHNCIDRNEKVKIKNAINAIDIKLNSSGYIYLKDIARHYEFYSIRRNDKPLFASLNIINSRYEFINNIENTFNITKECIDSLIEFLNLDKHVEYEKSNYVFRLYNKEDSIDEYSDFMEDNYFERRGGQVFGNRIIDFHTQYIDQFRIYITNNDEKIKEYSDSLQKSEEEIIYEINDTILSFIEKYIRLYHYYINNKYQIEKWLFYIQSENIKEIRNNLSKECGYKNNDKRYRLLGINDERNNDKKKETFFNSCN
jgi:hypothetical protein